MIRHATRPNFWKCYRQLPKTIRQQAKRNYHLLRANPYHPSLHLKEVNKKNHFWSARVNDNYRALAVRVDEGFIWVWIGSHREYERLIR